MEKNEGKSVQVKDVHELMTEFPGLPATTHHGNLVLVDMGPVEYLPTHYNSGARDITFTRFTYEEPCSCCGETIRWMRWTRKDTCRQRRKRRFFRCARCVDELWVSELKRRKQVAKREAVTDWLSKRTGGRWQPACSLYTH